MIFAEIAGQRIEFEWTLDGQPVSDWSAVREGQYEWKYRSGAFEAHLSVHERSECVYLLSVEVERGGEAFDLDQFKVRLRSPLRDLHRVWMPHLLLEGQLERVSLQWGFSYLTAANRCMPFVACLNRAGRNRASIGLVDQVTETEVRGCGFDPEARHVVEMSRPIEGITIRTRKHREAVYFNCGGGSWFDAIADFTRTYDEVEGVQMPALHAQAADPLYCTWYAHGPMVDQEKVLAELDLVRELGFRNYVIDEGWFGRGVEAAECIENVAKAVMSAILYCVPSIGMDFRKLPESHLKIVRQWLAFYQVHKEEITRGRWQPLEFDPHISTFAIHGERTAFVGLFKDVLGRIALDREQPLERFCLFNGTNSSHIHTRLEPGEGGYGLVVFDLFLEEIGRSQVRVDDRGLELKLEVPEGGMVEGVRFG